MYPRIDGTATTYAKEIHAVRGVHRKCLNRFTLLSKEVMSYEVRPLGFVRSRTGIFDQGRVHVDSYSWSVIIARVNFGSWWGERTVGVSSHSG